MNKYGEIDLTLSMLFAAFTPIDSSDFGDEEGKYSAHDHDACRDCKRRGAMLV